tara:strand:+ start:21793 stop:22533 length:741 start_codon:yes stop_codon:yes gene_type:complete
MAGCNTIWIVANDDLAPIIRKVIGEWIYDPVYYRRPSKFSSEERKEIPIYYVPIHPKDRDRRDSYGWSVLYGIYSAWRTAYKVSHWIVPEKYFVSFPFGVYDIYSIREHRRNISDRQNNLFFSYEGKTVKDNLPLPFTMTGEDFKLCRRAVNKKTTKEYLPPSPDQQYPSQKLPLHQRWSARQFDFVDIFGQVSDEKCEKVDLSWFSDISSWAGYRDFFASDNTIERPEKDLTTPRAHVKLPYTKE